MFKEHILWSLSDNRKWHKLQWMDDGVVRGYCTFIHIMSDISMTFHSFLTGSKDVIKGRILELSARSVAYRKLKSTIAYNIASYYWKIVYLLFFNNILYYFSIILIHTIFQYYFHRLLVELGVKGLLVCIRWK